MNLYNSDIGNIENDNAKQINHSLNDKSVKNNIWFNGVTAIISRITALINKEIINILFLKRLFLKK